MTDRKSVLIIMENMGVGGTYTSCLNLLSSIRSYPEIDIVVGLIEMGEREKFPEDIKVLDLSAFSRKKSGKLSKLTYNLRVGFFTRIKLKLLKSFGRKGALNSKKLVPLVQELEYKEAKKLKIQMDLSEEYDVVISWCEMFTNYLLAYKIKAKKKIAWIHPYYEQAGFSKRIDRKMISLVDGVVAVSKIGQECLKRVFPEYSDKFYCVYNKASVEEIIEKSKQEEIEYSNGVCNLITVARIQNVSKALDRMVLVVKQLCENGYKFKWRIIGDGEDFLEIKRLIETYSLQETIELMGAKNNPFPYVVASDLFLLCSRYEGLPMTIDEAQILGVPVMITNYESAKEQVNDGFNGFIVSNSFEGIYEGLSRVLNDVSVLETVKTNIKNQSRERYSDCLDFISLVESV